MHEAPCALKLQKAMEGTDVIDSG